MLEGRATVWVSHRDRRTYRQRGRMGVSEAHLHRQCLDYAQDPPADKAKEEPFSVAAQRRAFEAKMAVASGRQAQNEHFVVYSNWESDGCEGIHEGCPI